MLRGLLLRSLEGAARLRQEDVIQAGLVELEVGDRDAGLVEGADYVGELLGAVAEPDRGALRGPRNELAEGAEQLLRAAALRVIRRDDLHGRASDLGLEGVW